MTAQTQVQHTPGPWKWEPDPFDKEYYYALVSASDEYVIELEGAHQEAAWAMASKADARLISAAPDLLAALRALTAIGLTDDGGIIIGPQGWDLAQAAIAKATSS